MKSAQLFPLISNKMNWNWYEKIAYSTTNLSKNQLELTATKRKTVEKIPFVLFLSQKKRQNKLWTEKKAEQIASGEKDSANCQQGKRQ